MSDAKRMIYIREENIEFYNSLSNKSDFINGCLKTARLGGVDNISTTEVEEGPVPESVRIATINDAVESMRERDAKKLAEWRKQQGLSDPTKA